MCSESIMEHSTLSACKMLGNWIMWQILNTDNLSLWEVKPNQNLNKPKFKESFVLSDRPTRQALQFHRLSQQMERGFMKRYFGDNYNCCRSVTFSVFPAQFLRIRLRYHSQLQLPLQHLSNKKHVTLKFSFFSCLFFCFVFF